MLRNVATFGVMAVTLMVTAIPAAAAPSWSHNHERLEEDGTVTITGNAKFQAAFGSIDCQVTSMTQLTAKSATGTIDSFHPDVQGAETVKDNCQIGGGLVTVGCTEVTSVTTESLPWVLHTNTTNTSTVTTGAIQTHLLGGIFCPKTVQLTAGTVTLTVPHEQRHTIKEGTLSGTLQADPSIGAKENATITGSGSLTEGSGTYGTDVS